MTNLITSTFPVTFDHHTSHHPSSEQPEKSKEHSYRNVKVLAPSEFPSNSRSSRPFWYYLALGIPMLIELFSLTCQGITHRETMGEAVQFRFRYKHLPQSQINQISKFHRFQETTSSLLNSYSLDKAMEIANQLLVSLSKPAISQGNGILRDIQLEKYQSITALLEKNTNPQKAKNLDARDWKTLDMIDFEGAKGHFLDLVDIFNSNWFKNLGFGREMNKRFHVDYQEAVIAEVLSKSVAYIQGLDGKSLSFPVRDQITGVYHPVPYSIKEFYLGDALPCYIFESQHPHAKPWFVVRGTQFQKERIASLESVLADSIDCKGIAAKIVNKALVHRPIIKKNDQFIQKESLSDIFRQWRKENKQPNLTGHSLGGTLVNTIAVEFPDDLNTVYAFGAMGVARKTGDKYEKQASTLKNKIVNFDFEGDVVPSGGHCLIGRHLAIKAVFKAEQPISFYEAHVRVLLNRDFQIQEIEVPKENRKFVRVLCEKIRVFAGRILLFFLNIFGRKHLPDWWKQRKSYKMQANAQRLYVP